MTDKNLFSAIGNIDEKYIEEAADEEKARPRILILRYAAAAAAFLIVVSAGIGIFVKTPAKFEGEGLVSDIGQTLETDGNEELQNAGDSPDFVGLNNADSTDQNNSSAPSDRPNNTKGEGNSAYASSAAPGGTKGGKYSLVQINLENGYFYHYPSSSELLSLTAKPINEDNLGEKIAVLAPENTTRDSLAGCEVFMHRDINCDGLIIVKNGDELVPFVFLGFKSGAHDFSEILTIHGVDSSSDIEKITTRGLHDSIDDEKVIADSAQIKAVYDILINIHNDNGKNDRLKNQLHRSNNKTYIYLKLHFKNGLSYQSFYRVYPDKSYIENHDFLSDEQSEILKNILL